MSLITIPAELNDVSFVKSPVTGRLELPESATDEQRRAFKTYREAIDNSQQSACAIEE